MTEPRDQLRQVRQWLEKAEHDLRNAEHTLTIRDENAPSTQCVFTLSSASRSI